MPTLCVIFASAKPVECRQKCDKCVQLGGTGWETINAQGKQGLDGLYDLTSEMKYVK